MDGHLHVTHKKGCALTAITALRVKERQRLSHDLPQVMSAILEEIVLVVKREYIVIASKHVIM